MWLPPGEWTDGWSGKTVTGPKTIQVTPTESAGKFQIPMWHKRGGLLVTVQEGEQRINSQNWNEVCVNLSANRHVLHVPVMPLGRTHLHDCPDTYIRPACIAADH